MQNHKSLNNKTIMRAILKEEVKKKLPLNPENFLGRSGKSCFNIHLRESTICS